jgi:hypothetical protein
MEGLILKGGRPPLVMHNIFTFALEILLVSFHLLRKIALLV